MPASMIAESKNDVTQRFLNYAAPLATGPKEPFGAALFAPVRLKGYPVKKKLPEYG